MAGIGASGFGNLSRAHFLPGIPKGAGLNAHDFFGVTDSLKLKFVITPNPPADDAKHLNLADQPGRQGVIDGLAGTKADNDFGEPIGANGHAVAAPGSTAALSGLGPVAEPHSNPLPGALTAVPDLGLVAHALAGLPSARGPLSPLQATGGISSSTILRGSIVTSVVLVTTVPMSPVIASSGTVNASQTSIPTIPLVAAQGAIRADVSQVIGTDLTFQINLDVSPEIHFPDFDSFWVEPSSAPIELSPELRALLAQDPIPERSKITALDHLLGKVFSKSALLDWAHNLKPAVSAADPGHSIVADVKGITLASGYTTRAQWLAALKAADLAGNLKGLFAANSLFANLAAPIPQGVTFQKTLARPDFLEMVRQHQAWIAKNDPGFYSWRHKVEQQVEKKIEAEESGGLMQILGLVIAAVVVIVLSVVSYGVFSGFAAGLIGSMGVSAAAGTAVASVATTVLTGVLMGAAFGPLAPMLSTLIATGNFGKALSAGVAGGIIGMAAGALGAFGIGQWVSIALQTVVSNTGGVGTTILNVASTAVQSLVQGLENSMLGSLYQQVTTGHVPGIGLFKQWGFAALLAAATALAAYGLGHIIPWDKIGGPQVNSELTQKTEPVYDLNGRLVGNVNVSMTVGELVVKPALEGLAEYGIASAMGIRDAEAFGIGAAAGGYAAPFAINGVRDFLGSNDQVASLFSLGNTSYNSYVTRSVSGQITNLVGGIAAAIYDGNYQLGAYGANQVFTYNDESTLRLEKDGKLHREYGVPTNDPSAAYTNPDGLPITYYSVGTYNPETGMDTLDPQLQKLTGLREVPDEALGNYILRANTVAYAANVSAETQQEAVTISASEFVDRYTYNQLPSVQYQAHPDQYTLVPKLSPETASAFRPKPFLIHGTTRRASPAKSTSMAGSLCWAGRTQRLLSTHKERSSRLGLTVRPDFGLCHNFES
jgi:hypothetical protein